MAIRVARAYRTVSREAACVLAGSVPWVYMACSLKKIYDWKEERARGGEPATRESLEERRNRAKRDEF